MKLLKFAFFVPAKGINDKKKTTEIVNVAYVLIPSLNDHCGGLKFEKSELWSIFKVNIPNQHGAQE